MTRAVSLRLLPVAAATWSTAAIVTLWPAAAAWGTVALWFAALAALVFLAHRTTTQRRTSAALVTLLALVCAAMASSHVHFAQHAREEITKILAGDGRSLEIDAVVIGKVEHRADGSVAFDARLTKVRRGLDRITVHGEIVVRVDPSDVSGSLLDMGAVVAATGTGSPGRPGERAAAVFAARVMEVTAPARGPLAVTSDLRSHLVAATAGLPGLGAGLVPGLAVGDTSAVDPELDTAMKTASLSHLTAVSGANCALVVALAFAGAAGLGAGRRLRTVAGLLALVGFVVLVTPEPSVVRAAAMAAIAMLAVLLGRRAAGIGILSLSISLLLIVDPWLAMSLGFALSAAATAALLLLVRPLASGMAPRLGMPLATAIAVPLAAQLVCGPLLILVAPQIPVYGVIANLLAEPAAPVATVIGLAACLAAPLPLLQSGLAALAWIPATWIATTATTFAGLPTTLAPWVPGWWGALLLAVVGAGIAILIAVPPRGSRTQRWARGLSGIAAALMIGVLAGSAALSTVVGGWTLPAGWSVLACDVGQGDALLVRSGPAVALVDTGPDPAPLRACLDRAGIDRIDLLVLTHFDLDHIGGADAVIGRADVVLHGPQHGSAAELLGRFAAEGARIVDAEQGMRGSLGTSRWSVLWPRAESRAFPSGNDASVVIDFRGGGIPPMLTLGDLSASAQRALLAAHVLHPPYAVVKVAHHGSADQDAHLYESVNPAVGVISVGAGNDYGHPRQSILDTLTSIGTRVLRTDTGGLLAVWEDAEGVKVWCERGCVSGDR